MPLLATDYAGGTFEYQGSAATGAVTDRGRIDADRAGAGTVAVTDAPHGAPILNFASLGTRTAGATLKFAPAAGVGIQFATAVGANGILNGYSIFQNLDGTVDWVASTVANTNITKFTGYIPLPTSATTNTVNYSVTGAASTNQTDAVNTLKIVGAQTITLGGNITFTTNPGGLLFDDSSGAALITASSARTIGTAAQELVITVAGTTSGGYGIDEHAHA